MNTLDELLYPVAIDGQQLADSVEYLDSVSVVRISDVKKIMKEYATLCCEAQKKACAENAKLDVIENEGLPSYWYDVSIDKESILNTETTLL